MNQVELCPCGSKSSFESCCLKRHQDLGSAKTAEQLMRSRYSAFVKSDLAYLLATSSNQLLCNIDKNELQSTIESCHFINLQIIDSSESKVEFIASYIIADKLEKIHELSSFVKEDNVWKYHSGQHFATPVVKIARNDLCPCGSGKKFKKCHMQ